MVEGRHLATVRICGRDCRGLAVDSTLDSLGNSVDHYRLPAYSIDRRHFRQPAEPRQFSKRVSIMSREPTWSKSRVTQALMEFDGKRTAVLDQLIASLDRNKETVTLMLDVADHRETNVQVGATWILKRWFKNEQLLFDGMTSKCTKLLMKAKHWEVRLHLLQVVALMHIPAEALSGLKNLLTDLLQDENKLVRAWSLSAFATLADQHPKLRGQARSEMKTAEIDGPASVRARIRQIRKHYRWAANP